VHETRTLCPADLHPDTAADLQVRRADQNAEPNMRMLGCESTHLCMRFKHVQGDVLPIRCLGLDVHSAYKHCAHRMCMLSRRAGSQAHFAWSSHIQTVIS